MNKKFTKNFETGVCDSVEDSFPLMPKKEFLCPKKRSLRVFWSQRFIVLTNFLLKEHLRGPSITRPGKIMLMTERGIALMKMANSETETFEKRMQLELFRMSTQKVTNKGYSNRENLNKTESTFLNIFKLVFVIVQDTVVRKSYPKTCQIEESNFEHPCYKKNNLTTDSQKTAFSMDFYRIEKSNLL